MGETNATSSKVILNISIGTHLKIVFNSLIVFQVDT